eukprot:6256866-Pyramimonas_sp.AAC.1
MQNDFCLPDRALCVKGAMGCLDKVEEAVNFAREKKVPLFWVCREHDPSGCDIELTRAHLFQNGGKGTCVTGTEAVRRPLKVGSKYPKGWLGDSTGAALVDPLTREEGDHYIAKKRWSGFFNTHLDSVLKRLGVTTLVLAGVQTPNCIRGTAYDAIALDYPEVSRVACCRERSAGHMECGCELARLK